MSDQVIIVKVCIGLAFVYISAVYASCSCTAGQDLWSTLDSLKDTIDGLWMGLGLQRGLVCR